ncbi:MAG: CinA family nicotinamide mononucleotide deamidase-related protein [Muribaculaceae bacterium]|nr:CinA family nicotinamide mononucleotide deamidase-related protein [Muribaculaceae bacterium]
MKISIIVIGDEILIGQVTDINSGYIANVVRPAGWSVDSVATVGDDATAITTAIKAALKRTDIVLTTGGLGPTKDDITKEVLTKIFGGRLRLDPSVAENVSRICHKRRIKLNDLTARQAMVPSSCRVIQNDVGTAPLMWFERPDGKVLVAMPGVPFEMQSMFTNKVFPELLKQFGSRDFIGHRVALINGLIESEIAHRMNRFESELPENFRLAYLPTPGLVRLRLDGEGPDRKVVEAELDRQFEKLVAEFGPNVLWESDMKLPEIAIELLKKHNLTVSTAESCTGGFISGALTYIPGSSAVVRGAVVAYSNDVKRDVLGVNEKCIEEYGAVSLPVVEQMAEGAKRLIHTDCVIATSGIAGPGGGTAAKPVGTICISVITPGGTSVNHYRFTGGRSQIIERTVNTALIKLITELKKL